MAASFRGEVDMDLRETRTTDTCSRRVIPALLVIALGMFFLLENLGVDIAFLDHRNWWAWFILLGAVSPLSIAVQRYRMVGALDGKVQHSLLTAAAIIMVALMFIVPLSWGQWWPVFVIYGGLCMLTRDRRHTPEQIAP
jgi:hypothetical protein